MRLPSKLSQRFTHILVRFEGLVEGYNLKPGLHSQSNWALHIRRGKFEFRDITLRVRPERF